MSQISPSLSTWICTPRREARAVWARYSPRMTLRGGKTDPSRRHPPITSQPWVLGMQNYPRSRAIVQSRWRLQMTSTPLQAYHLSQVVSCPLTQHLPPTSTLKAITSPISDRKLKRKPRKRPIKNVGDRRKRLKCMRPSKMNVSKKLMKILKPVKTKMISRRNVVANRHASHAFNSESAKRYTRSTWTWFSSSSPPTYFRGIKSLKILMTPMCLMKTSSNYVSCDNAASFGHLPFYVTICTFYTFFYRIYLSFPNQRFSPLLSPPFPPFLCISGSCVPREPSQKPSFVPILSFATKFDFSGRLPN